MREIRQRVSRLRPRLAWHLARITLLAQFMVALTRVNTRNLMRVAEGFVGPAQTASCYTRLQRFLRHAELRPDSVAPLLVRLIEREPPWRVCLDRTHWQLGRRHITLRVRSLTGRPVSIPWLGSQLDKAGNSHTDERKALLKRYLSLLPRDTSDALLADRECRGQAWLKYRKGENMPFTLRIPNHTSVRTRKGQPVAVATLFRLGVRQSMVRNKARRVWGEPVYLACFRADKEFVVVVSDRPATQALSAYQPRWQTECLVPCVNGRGFDLEATHVTRPERRERRLVLVSSTFCWCDQVGGGNSSA